MATKAEEIKALEQIEKIISSLGENSYIATAMDGMIEDARENIENDFALSWKDRADNLNRTNLKLHDEIDMLNAQIANQAKTIEQQDGWLVQKSARIDELNRQIKDACDTLSDRLEKLDVASAKITGLENEIIHLKAKLYDMMCSRAKEE